MEKDVESVEKQLYKMGFKKWKTFPSINRKNDRVNIIYQNGVQTECD